MWLKNEGHSTSAQKWNSWKRINLVSLMLIGIVSHASGKLNFPPIRDALVAKDSNTLLNPEFLPFLTECTSSNVNQLNEPLCTMYYDMVYNVYQYGANAADARAEIIKANTTLEHNSRMSDLFCGFFPNETAIALDKQPFSKINNFNILRWIQTKRICDLHCLYDTITEPIEVKIKPVCKFISGGCKWISKQKQNAIPTISTPVEPNLSGKTNENENAKLKENPIPNPILNSNLNLNGNSNLKPNPIQNPDESPVNGPIIDTGNAAAIEAGPVDVNQISNPELSKDDTEKGKEKSTNRETKVKPSGSTSVSKQGDPSIPAVPEPPKANTNITPTLNKASPPTVIDMKLNKPKANVAENIEKIVKPAVQNEISPTIIPNEDESSYINNEQKNDNDNEAKQEDDTDLDQDGDLGGEDTHDDDHEQLRNDIKSNSNNNNMQQSHLSAEVGEFREDKESSFFPYFMFLMFVIVTFYVAYHNKSKILALLIEGRRSRSYSSRGGSRRKQHSAEYRKLDSNLEEAIQSDGGHVMSTQIIY